MNILIVAPSWIGDTVAAQPLLMRLREHHPDARIDVLAPPWVAAVLKAMPEVNGDVISNPFAHGQLRLRGRWALARQLKTHNYDAAYVLPNSLKSALIPFFAGIRRRVGFIGESRYGLINVRHRLNEQRLPLQVERYAQLAEQPGSALSRPLPNPSLHVEPDDIARIFNAFDIDTTPVIFCPGAEYGPAKRWPEKHFADLARQLVAAGNTVLLLGSKKDAPVGEEIVRLSSGAARNLCGITDLDQAIHLLAAAQFVVSNDSGLMHVAAALDKRLVALFGSSSPLYTPPLSHNAHVLWLKLVCSPCFQRECPLGHLNCLNQIAPEQVTSITNKWST
ncbi:MAG TPA: lipopolysaccharide heptosyltransferase II [Rhodocyclaceae bacterium]|nr:lipopolysaccharide heptosyltransferase II [Rhodocyclaceae bacterium]